MNIEVTDYATRSAMVGVQAAAGPAAVLQRKPYRESPRILALLAVVLLAGGCVTQEIRVVDMTPPEQYVGYQDEDELLDIGIAVFDPNVPESYDEQVELLIQPDIRRAEANYIPYFTKNLLQSTGNWGAVRVVPRPTHAVDVSVTGTILHSDGESMMVEIKVSDATGTHWFTRTYEALASKYAYEDGIPPNIDPFQGIYRNLSDDMLAYRTNLTPEHIKVIRTTAEMKFAQGFAPDAFADHLEEDDNGNFVLKRLPAEDDPTLGRVQQIREREYLFIDTLDEYFETYHRDMYPSYQNWRRATYSEAIALKELKAQARARTIGGAAAIIGGIAAMAESGDSYMESTGLLGVISGAMIMKSAYAKRAEASIHAEVLQEVGVAAEAEIVPYTIELENQSVRLQGTVDEQYDELRAILRRMYFADLGLPLPEVPLPEDPLESVNE